MMNINVPSGPLTLETADVISLAWTVSYSTISDTTAGVTADVTASGVLAGPAAVDIVSPVAGSTKQVKNINVKTIGAGAMQFNIGVVE